MTRTERKQTRRMKWALFCIFLMIFVVIVAGTIATVFFDFGKPTTEERSILFKVFIGEVGIAVLALFRVLFGLKKKDAEIEEMKIPKISGKYKYEAYHSDNKVISIGVCRVKQMGRVLEFNGEWQKVIVNGKKENLSLRWSSNWAELCMDNKVRLDYSVTQNGGDRGFVIIEPGRTSSETVVGEFHALRKPYICGTIKFKRI